MVELSVLRQAPSRALCAQMCGAQCCRAPGYVLLTEAEARAFRRRLAEGGGKVPQMTRHAPGTWALDFGRNGGRCPFLTEESLCAIYAERPGACRRFPVRPTPGCLAWPEG